MARLLRPISVAAPLFFALLGVGCESGETATSAGAGGSTSTSSTGAGGSGTGGSAGGGGGSVSTQTFTPKGCQFEIAPRPEYLDWSSGKSDVGMAPNIRRVRLGLGGNITPGAPGKADPSTSVGVAWQTDDGTLASEIMWGESTDPSAWPAENRASGVTWLTPEGLIAPNGDVRMHEVHICGLKPNSTYSYRVGGGLAGSEVWSDVYRFTTAPENGDTPVTIAINGDARGQNGSAWRLFQRKVLAKGTTVQLFSGDTINLALDQTEWESWLDLGWKDDDGSLLTLGQVLTLGTNGNHDNRSTLFFGNMVFPQEAKSYSSYAELIYSVDVGPVHVTVLDDTYFASKLVPEEEKTAVAAWLDADLTAANANRANVPWLIALHHRGPLSSSNHGGDADVFRVREFLMPLYDKFHVDMDVAGHDHNYERSQPVTGPADKPVVHADPKDGTVYVLCAGAGAPAYSPGTSDFTAISKGYKSGGAIGVYGFLTASKTELKLEAFELRPDGTDPKFDTLVITK